MQVMIISLPNQYTQNAKSVHLFGINVTESIGCNVAFGQNLSENTELIRTKNGLLAFIILISGLRIVYLHSSFLCGHTFDECCELQYWILFTA